MSDNNKNNFRVVVIGAGMSGILAGIKLLEDGINNFVIYEKAGKIGGTWRDNRYPGLACDVPAHAYTYSFEPNPNWSKYFAPGYEIQEYFENVVKKYGLQKHIRFNQELVSAEFDDGSWHLEMSSGIQDRADFIVAATGVLHYEKYPQIKGLASFNGTMMHSARWDETVELEDKKVAVIGSGSTAVQIVTALTGKSKVIQFQRSAQWMLHVPNAEFSEEEKQAFRTNPELLKQMQNPEELKQAVQAFTDAITDAESEGIKQISELALENLENSIRDQELKEKLRPDYLAACKRLIRTPDYYESIQHPENQLITDQITQIEPEGIRLDTGELIEVDVIAFATGFHADKFLRPARITGRDGVSLEDVWAVRPTAYMATSIPGFPNMAMLNGPTGPVGNFSVIDISEHQFGYIRQLIDAVRSGRCREICATKQAHESYEEERIDSAKKTVFGSGCTSWYLDKEGIPTTWPWSMQRFFDEMSEIKIDDYELV